MQRSVKSTSASGESKVKPSPQQEAKARSPSAEPHLDEARRAARKQAARDVLLAARGAAVATAIADKTAEDWLRKYHSELVKDILAETLAADTLYKANQALENLLDVKSTARTDAMSARSAHMRGSLLKGMDDRLMEYETHMFEHKEQLLKKFKGFGLRP